MGWLTSLIGGWQGLALAAGLSALLAGAGTGYIVHRIDASALSDLKASDAAAQTKAVQAASLALQKQDKAVLDAAVAEARSQQQIVTKTVTLIKEIPVHVTDTSECGTPTFGLIRLLQSAALGTDTTGIAPSPGQPDGACSGLSWRSFATDLADDYGNARANAEQLNALEDSVVAIHNAAH